jgi:hypothetical protein
MSHARHWLHALVSTLGLSHCASCQQSSGDPFAELAMLPDVGGSTAAEGRQAPNVIASGSTARSSLACGQERHLSTWATSLHGWNVAFRARVEGAPASFTAEVRSPDGTLRGSLRTRLTSTASGGEIVRVPVLVTGASTPMPEGNWDVLYRAEGGCQRVLLLVAFEAPAMPGP